MKIEAGKRYTTKIGKNEIEVTAVKEVKGGWECLTKSNRKMTVKNFVKCLEEKTASESPKESKKTSTKKSASEKIKRPSMMSAVNHLLKSGKGMTATELIEEMKAKGLWESPNGKTPVNTLSAALNRECKKDSPIYKKTDAKFSLIKR